MNPLLVAAGWCLVGAAAGHGVRRASVWLAEKEELESGDRAWMVWGPVVLAAVLFAAFGWRYGASPLLLVKSLWVLILVHVIFFDLEHRLILDRVTVPSYVLAFIVSLLSGSPGWRWSLVAAVAAGAAFGLFALAGALIFRAEVLGLGDVKLAVFIGLVAGAWTAQALLLGIILAGVTSILLIVIRAKSLRDTIAYGPYLCAGALVVLLERAGG
jgi:prepilin signal peptidase PulO-like enzyme (type II secretory pathway)